MDLMGMYGRWGQLVYTGWLLGLSKRVDDVEGGTSLEREIGKENDEFSYWHEFELLVRTQTTFTQWIRLF